MYEKIRMRWLTVASFEMQLGNTRVVTDPFITDSPATDLTWEDIDQCDIITVTHAHWDHVTDIPQLMKKFNSKLLVGELTLLPMARWLDCNAHYIYPMNPGVALDFGDVKVTGLYGHHTNLKATVSELEERMKNRPLFDKFPGLLETQVIGTLEYRNYLFTLPSGKTIFVWGGAPTIEQRNMFKGLNPDVAILQLSGYEPAAVAQMGADIGARVIIPHHMDLSKTPEEYLPRVEALGVEFKKLVPEGEVVFHPQGEWFEV